MSNLITGTGIVACGDVISQFLEHDKTGKRKVERLQELDARRTVNAGITGFVFNGVLMPQWYRFIHKLMPGAETPRTVGIKILMNCAAWGFAGNG
jgi:hypothetical protein